MRRLIAVCSMFAVLVAGQAFAQTAQKKPSAPRTSMVGKAGKMALTGAPTTLVGCAGGEFYNVHQLGSSVRGTRITVEVEGDESFDAVAAATVLQMGAATPQQTSRLSYQYNDDGSATSLDPRLEFVLEHDASVVLQIGSFDGAFGCYLLRVGISIPQ